MKVNGKMRVRASFVGLLLAAVAPGSALARGPESYCQDRQRLQQQVTDCDQNERYAEAAVLCLEKLETEIDVVKRLVAAEMGARNRATDEAQKDTLNTTRRNYGSATNALNNLIARTEATIGEVQGYGEDVALPEDSDNHEITGGNLDGHLSSEPCFQETAELLDSVLKDLRGYLDDLKKTRDVTLAHGATTGRREANVDAVNPSVGAPVSGVGRATGNAPKGKRIRQSDVSGTERLKTQQAR